MGKSDLDALKQISRHPIGTAQINFFVAAIGEIKDAAVFQEPADNTAHPDMVADAAHARPQPAYATHDQVDLHARLRGAIEFADDVAVEQGIHLGDDPRRTPVSGVIGFARDQVDTALRQIDGRNQQRIVTWAAPRTP